MTNHYSYGEALHDLRSLLNMYDDVRLAVPARGRVGVDVPRILLELLKTAKGRDRKIAARVRAELHDDPFALKVAVMAAVAFYEKVFDGWEASEPLRKKSRAVLERTARVMGAYRKLLDELRGLLGMWKRDDVRFAVPTRDIGIDVRDTLVDMLESEGDLVDRIGSELRDRPFAAKLVILAAVRHHAEVLAAWRPPDALLQKHRFITTMARSATKPFDRMCEHDCTDDNCPYLHGHAGLPSDDEFFASLTK